jgi:hypothetical protein
MNASVRYLILAAAAIGALACNEGESNPTAPRGISANAGINTIVTSGPLNASSTDTLIYFSFDNDTLTTKSGAWDIALRRYEIELNGGVDGTAEVAGYSFGNDTAATGPQVLAFTPANTLAAFDAIRDTQIPADSMFVSDHIFEDNTAYLNFAGAPAANAETYWKVKTALGGYALMRATAIVLSPSFALTSVSFEVRAQTGSTLGAAQSFTVAIGANPVAVSFANLGAVTAAGCNWDLQVNPQDFSISVNSACGAGTYPGPSSPLFADASSASDAPQYGAYLAGMTGPIPNSVTDPAAPFRYNLQGTNRLDPAFNTYLVKNGAKIYKLQVINYYSAAGTSGWPTIRFARIR